MPVTNFSTFTSLLGLFEVCLYQALNSVGTTGMEDVAHPDCFWTHLGDVIKVQVEEYAKKLQEKSLRRKIIVYSKSEVRETLSWRS